MTINVWVQLRWACIIRTGFSPHELTGQMQIDGVILSPLETLAVVNVIGKVLEKITPRVPDGLALKSFDPGRRESERTEKIETVAFIRHGEGQNTPFRQQAI